MQGGLDLVQELLDENLYPWQKAIRDVSKIFDSRTVNLLVDPSGGSGKSALLSFMCSRGEAITFPSAKSAKNLVRKMCTFCISNNIRAPGCLIVDLPQSNISSIFVVLEQIKDGYLYDFKYSFKEYFIDSPCIWVFCDKLPDFKILSNDRYKFWKIHNSRDLVLYTHID